MLLSAATFSCSILSLISELPLILGNFFCWMRSCDLQFLCHAFMRFHIFHQSIRCCWKFCCPFLLQTNPPSAKCSPRHPSTPPAPAACQPPPKELWLGLGLLQPPVHKPGDWPVKQSFREQTRTCGKRGEEKKKKMFAYLYWNGASAVWHGRDVLSVSSADFTRN